jgi:mannosylglycerate hydrolase
MKPVVIVVSHTHWDREWYRPAEVFRLRLAERVSELLDVLDRDAGFRHFMLDGQTVCVDDVLALRPSLRDRLQARLREGRIGIGPWYVLQDELLVGGESIVRNLGEGLRAARAHGRAMSIGYLPDAFGHTAFMPRILRGFGIETAVLWRGVAGASPELRWRSPDGSEVLCLWLPGGYGNADRLGDEAQALERLRRDLGDSKSQAAVLLWMNGTDHRPVEAQVPSVIAALGRAMPEVTLEHATLERAEELVRSRVELARLPVIEGELRTATRDVPVLSGTWSTRSWQKRDHDEAEALLVSHAEPIAAFAPGDRREALRHAWRLLLRCQPHDSICGCSVDEVHREIDTRLARVRQLGAELVRDGVQALLAAPTPDFAVHEAVALWNPHPRSIDAVVDVELQRLRGAPPFRLTGPAGEVGYDIMSLWPSESPDRHPTEWLRLRLQARALPPLGLRVLTVADGEPIPSEPTPSAIAVRSIRGGLALDDGDGRTLTLTLEDEDDRGDLYDFCPTGAPARSSRDHDLGVHVEARAIGRRVELDLCIDNTRGDHRLRARFTPSWPLGTVRSDTAFGWIERSAPGTHPVSRVIAADGVALGGLGLHEMERATDGAILLTLLRCVGWMSKGNLSTRHGHAGYALPTPEAQGLGIHRYRVVIAFGADAIAEVDAGLVPPRAFPLAATQARDVSLLDLGARGARLSIIKRADDDDGVIVRLVGPPEGTSTVRLTGTVERSDLDERRGASCATELPIAANETLTLRTTPRPAG